ncbi:MAG TPA: patatin-like phospholipase family protein, partial [Ilumatobacteraceae bacterium]|nr:patatin-like phospholipase family protein [Ilumatobacteraceae bacterium]
MKPQPSPLESPALGASFSSLISPCGDTLRPAEPPPAAGVRIGVTLSGGGFRATFAGLGVARFLAGAGLLGDLRFVSSVSGGSVANGMLATRFPQLRKRGFSGAAFDDLVIEPIAERVTAASLKSKLVRNMWRTFGKRNRTDVLARAFNDWLFDDVKLEDLDPGCRWIFNAASLTTGARFGFERDVVGDYVVGLAPTAGTGLQVAQAVAASAAVPGAFAAMKIDQVKFPCAGRGVPHLLDGGTYDNTGLEA